MRRSAHAGKMLGQRRRHHAITGSRSDGVRGAPVAETGFSHRLTAYKIVGHFFGLSYLYISRHNEVENCFFRSSNISVPCPHTQLRGRTVIKKLWTFFGPRGRHHSKSPPCCIFRVKQINPRLRTRLGSGGVRTLYMVMSSSRARCVQ